MNKTLKNHMTYVLFASLLVANFTSCVENNADDATPRLKVDKVNINVIQTGKLSTGVSASFKLVANLGYEISSDVDWIIPNKPTGTGATDVTLSIRANETGDTRVGYLTIKSHDLSETITITQTMDPDTDDGEEVGYMYMEENFAFFEQFGGQDQLTYPDQGSTVSVRSKDEVVKVFESKGYGDYNYNGNCMYMAKHYLKMGKNNNQTGLTLLLKNIKAGKSTNIDLTFDAAPVVSVDGTGDAITLKGIDDTSIAVEKLEGPGSIGNTTSIVSGILPLSSVTSWNQWSSISVTLYGVTSKTRIAIRSTQQGLTGYHRWYLDNVKMVKAPRGN